MAGSPAREWRRIGDDGPSIIERVDVDLGTNSLLWRINSLIVAN